MKLTVTKRLLLLLLSIFFFAQVFAQEKTITGTVTDDKGNTLPDATVLVKNTRLATKTDATGNFSLKVPASAKALIVSFIGMQDLEVPIGKKSNFNVSLTPASATLNDVVVIGYGTAKKTDLTGAVQRVNREDLNKNAPSNVLSAMQGKLAGVNVTQNDGAPGAGISVRIRGSNSFLGGTEPLYVIDGVPFNNNNSGSTPASLKEDEKQTVNALSFLNPNDIESIDVLKDASATAIYGSRGANGVVIITTRKGRTGKDKVEISATTGLSEVSKKLQMLNAVDYATYENTAYANSNRYNGTSYDLPYPGITKPSATNPDSLVYYPAPNDYAGKGTNWQNVIFRKAVYQNYSVNISGGNEAGNHSLSFHYLNQDGIIINSNYRRYGANLNLNRNLGKYVKVGTSTSISHSTMNGVKTGTTKSDDADAGVVRAAMSFPSVNELIDPATNTFSYVYFISNPYIYTRDILNKITSKNIFSSNYLEVTFLKDFKFRQNIGFNYAYNLRDQYYPRTIYEGRTKKGWALKSDDQWGSFLSESYLTYNKQLNKHNINVFAGSTYELTQSQWKRMDAADFPNDDLQNENMGAGALQQTLQPPYNSKSQATLISFLARANYSFDNRYLLTASIRRDGSSKFGTDNKWANFPSFAFAWKMAEESFIKKLDVFSDLRFRASYGQTGNQGIGSYASLSKLVVYNYPFGGGLQTGLADDFYAGPANNQLKWETTIAYNLGLDFGFFNNRLALHIDAYRKRTNDLLQNVTIPPTTGFPTRLVNSGSVENKGLEIAVEGLAIKKKDFSWNTNFNISWNRNKILSLGDDVKRQFAGYISTYDAPFIQEVGHPIGSVYGYVEDGFYDNEAEVRNDPAFSNQPDAIIKGKIGEIKYKDLDGVPGITEADRRYIGDVNPKYTYGFTNTFTYRRFELSVFINGSQGNDVLNMTTRFLQDMGGDKNIMQEMYEGTWTEGKLTANASWPKIVRGFTRTFYFTRRYIEDGSYVRIKNITLSYAMPAKVIGIPGLKFSLGVNNVYTFTKYKGYDPEVNGFGDNPAMFGVDLGGYPNTRTYNFSIHANL